MSCTNPANIMKRRHVLTRDLGGIKNGYPQFLSWGGTEGSWKSQGQLQHDNHLQDSTGHHTSKWTGASSTSQSSSIPRGIYLEGVLLRLQACQKAKTQSRRTGKTLDLPGDEVELRSS